MNRHYNVMYNQTCTKTLEVEDNLNAATWLMKAADYSHPAFQRSEYGTENGTDLATRLYSSLPTLTFILKMRSLQTSLYW